MYEILKFDVDTTHYLITYNNLMIGVNLKVLKLDRYMEL